ncbi:MAG TPA: hypothetical protein VE093_03955 [Polyangiaceae bacterium]|nr:hypothetical protein [Polyangiaceae bacterium]
MSCCDNKNPTPPTPTPPTPPVQQCPANVTITLVTPAGDPVSAPNSTQGADGQNEFTFSAATPGVLTMNLKARVDPSGCAASVQERVRFQVTPIGASVMAWDPANPNGRPTVSGDFLLATVTFTGLPAQNADFGAKVVTLTLDGASHRTANCEVFFPKNAQNHPNPEQGTTPNWFFYWMQVMSSPGHVRYGGAGPGNLLGEARGMTKWSYGAVPDKTLVHIYDLAATRDAAIPGLHGPLSGIDLFRNTVWHETEHTRQIARADPVVGTHSGTCWANGWSWNQPNHNHWRLGPGRVAGTPGLCTSAGPGTMGDAGSGDTLLSAAVPGMPNYRSWPTAWGAVPAGASPDGSFIGGTPIEQQAYQQETGPEHGLARQDWGDPGKNHNTVNRFDD